MESLGVVIGGVTVAVVDIAAESGVDIDIDERTNREVSGCRTRFSGIKEVVAVFRIVSRLRYTAVVRRSAQLVLLLIGQVMQKIGLDKER